MLMEQLQQCQECAPVSFFSAGTLPLITGGPTPSLACHVVCQTLKYFGHLGAIMVFSKLCVHWDFFGRKSSLMETFQVMPQTIILAGQSRFSHFSKSFDWMIHFLIHSHRANFRGKFCRSSRTFPEAVSLHGYRNSHEVNGRCSFITGLQFCEGLSIIIYWLQKEVGRCSEGGYRISWVCCFPYFPKANSDLPSNVPL